MACGGEAAASTEGARPGGGTGCSQRQLGVSTAPCQCRGGKADRTSIQLALRLCVQCLLNKINIGHIVHKTLTGGSALYVVYR